MTELYRLARTLERAAREWADVEGGGAGAAYVDRLSGGGADPGVIPTMAGFRITLPPGPIRDHRFTITITEERG